MAPRIRAGGLFVLEEGGLEKMDPGEMAQEDSSDTFKAAVIYPRVFTDLLRCCNSGLKKKKIHRAHLEDVLRYFSKG